MARDRLDKALVDRGLVESRERAKALILAGKVRVNGHRADKAGRAINPDDNLEVVGKDHPWVSRGGLKLAAAFAHFDIDARDRVAIDIGASTGGFTDVLLHHGARKVHALDVGYGQLAWKLRSDDRVIVIERQNIRHYDITQLDEPCTLAVTDVSFISLTLVLPKMQEILRAANGGQALVLIKPQFEVGKNDVGKGGVVRDPDARQRAVDKVCTWCTEHEVEVCGVIESPVRGPAGNIEFLCWLRVAA